MSSLPSAFFTADSIIAISVALRYRGIFCDVDSASRQFTRKCDECLSRELVWNRCQLNKFFVALCLVTLYEVRDLHRRDGNSFAKH